MHLGLFALGLLALAIRRRPLALALVAVLVVVNVGYFARLPFANVRNVVVVTVAGALLAGCGLRATVRRLPRSARPALEVGLTLSLAVFPDARIFRSTSGALFAGMGLLVLAHAGLHRRLDRLARHPLPDAALTRRPRRAVPALTPAP